MNKMSSTWYHFKFGLWIHFSNFIHINISKQKEQKQLNKLLVIVAVWKNIKGPDSSKTSVVPILWFRQQKQVLSMRRYHKVCIPSRMYYIIQSQK